LAVGQLHCIAPAGATGRSFLRRQGFAPPPVDIGDGVQGRGRPEDAPVIVLHPKDLPGVGIDHQVYGPTGQLVGDLEALALVGDGAVFAHVASHAVVEQRVDPGSQGTQGTDPRQILLVALQRRASFERAVGRGVVDGLEPRPQPCVEVTEVAQPGGVELTEKMIPESSMPPFQLTLSLLMGSSP